MYPSRKELRVLRIGASILERQDGDGFLVGKVCVRRSTIIVQPDPSEQENDGNRQCCDDPDIQFLPGLTSNRLAAIDLLFPLQAFGRKFKGPGENNGDGKTYDQ